MALFLTALSVRLSSCTLSVLALSIGSETLNKGPDSEGAVCLISRSLIKLLHRIGPKMDP